MGLDKATLKVPTQPLIFFNNKIVMPMGVITLKVFGAKRILDVDFLVINCHSAFNAIIGRAWIHSIQGVMSTLHQVMMYRSPDLTYTIDIRGIREQ